MSELQYDYGMIGLGTMGYNMVLNMADKGYNVAGLDKDPQKGASLSGETSNGELKGFHDTGAFMAALKKPAVIMMLVPTGATVDAVIKEISPSLKRGDLLIDCGNSHYTDTQRRQADLEGRGIDFLGAGISGGSEGARTGLCIMAGGKPEAYDKVKNLLLAIAAKVEQQPCCVYCGEGAAGHFVKMVHNGIEYAQMQVIAEAYHLMKKVGCLNNEELADVFDSFNQSPIASYLIEITAELFRLPDSQSDEKIVDRILDTAKQKGTGAWASTAAMQLQVPVPSLDVAVSQRILSSLKDLRIKTAAISATESAANIETGAGGLVAIVKDAIHFCMIVHFAQGISLLQKASATYNYKTDIAAVANAWRGGCIIRAEMLKDISTAYAANPLLQNLMMNNVFNHRLQTSSAYLRSAIQTALDAAIPVPVMMNGLAYADSLRSAWLPANLIQAQRDLFGAHGFQRTDMAGEFHLNAATS